MLCSICIDILEWHQGLVGSNENHDFFAHQPTVGSLEESAAQGCHICRPVWFRFIDRESGTPWLWNSEDVEVAQVHEPRYITWCGLKKMKQSPPTRFNIYRGPDLVPRPFSRTDFTDPDLFTLLPVLDNACSVTNIPRSSNTSSAASWEIAATWIHDCLSHHESCNRIAPSWYPARLLEISQDPNFANTIRLIITANNVPSGPYMTLSHRWAKTPMIKLLRSNLASFCSNIPLTRLPKTFRDAVTITRRLGVRYIWIDSLCIIQDQDDLSDWFKEAALMDKVYSHSYCNISATAAEDSSEGLFFDRNPCILGSAQVNLRVQGSGEDVGWLKCEILEMHFWTRNVSNSPLNKRGWVFQERLLSPRILHFGRDELFWECHELEAAESYPAGLPASLETAFTGFKSKVLDTTKYTSSLSKPKEDHGWDLVVKIYSRTLLTKAEDKLVALSGVAKKVRGVINDEYVAGLWRKELATSLTWYVDSRHTSRPPIYRAPTWSWASVDGELSIGVPVPNSFFVVDDVQLQYATQDDTGAITGGYLDLRGHLKPFHLMQRKRHSKDTEYGLMGYTQRFENERLDWLEMTAAVDVPSDGLHLKDENSMLYYMPGNAQQYDDGPRVHGLLLKLVDRQSGVFERIGIAYQEFCFDGELDELIAILKEPVSVPCKSFRDGMHTVRII